MSILLPLLLVAGIYDYSLPDTQGGTINLNSYHNKKILIVNTASNTEQAWQFTKLEELYEKYKDSLVVIAVPSNSFGNEQDADSVIYNHLTVDYDASYVIAGKTEVAGDSVCELYQWLSQISKNGALETPVTKDFQKFLIDGEGNLIGVFAAELDPMNNQIQNAITGTY